MNSRRALKDRSFVISVNVFSRRSAFCPQVFPSHLRNNTDSQTTSAFLKCLFLASCSLTNVHGIIFLPRVRSLLTDLPLDNSIRTAIWRPLLLCSCALINHDTLTSGFRPQVTSLLTDLLLADSIRQLHGFHFLDFAYSLKYHNTLTSGFCPQVISC
jgi:hypothetical protein